MAPPLRVMSYNLRRDSAGDAPHVWGARVDVLADVVRREAPHVLGTQEGLAHQLADLDERLPGFSRVGGPRLPGDEACALYYDPARVALLEWGEFWHCATPEAPGSNAWGNRHPRITTWARFRDAAWDAPVLVANTHFDHGAPGLRVRAAALHAARVPGALLMGDINARPDERAMGVLRAAGWDDAGAREATFHGFTGVATARLDHVLAPPTLRIRAHKVVRGQRGGIHASDHHAVVAAVEPAAPSA